MTKMNFKKDDDIVILVLNGKDYIQQHTNASAPFTLQPGSVPVSPTVELWVATADTSCKVDTTDYIDDAATVSHYAIVGPRPRNIIRR